MAILPKTWANLTDAYNGGAYQIVFMQIVPPNLYVLVRDQRVDNHLEAWSVSP